ncbi:MAG: NAD(+) diphosphatase [Treponemataceae bacterium]|nr:NAD(+) diphosphatase [Treponemataceae bacterium]
MPLHYIFCNYSILVMDSDKLALPDDEVVQKCFEHQVVIDWFGEPEYQYTAIALEDDCPAPKGCKWVPIRSLFVKANAGNTEVSRAARAHSLLKWRKKKRYCPKCGTLMLDDERETARLCPKCKSKLYPSVTPAMIVLIEKGDEILLARHVERNNDIFTCLAGFIEAGESAEEAVRREIHEEVGIEVENIRYITSQAWPFPDQLMLAFKASYKSGEIVLQEDEIEEAHWFKKNDLPAIPKEGSVAWSLITGEI